LPHVLTEP
jgi:hypothetical protein